MKVYFKPGTNQFPKGGEKDGIVYSYFDEGRVCIGRNYVTVKARQQHDNIVSMQQYTLSVWQILPESFKKDLASYTRIYKKRGRARRAKYMSAYSVFLKITHYLNKHGLLSKIKDQIPEVFLQKFRQLNVYLCIQMRIIPFIPNSYLLNRCLHQQVYFYIENPNLHFSRKNINSLLFHNQACYFKEEKSNRQIEDLQIKAHIRLLPVW